MNCRTSRSTEPKCIVCEADHDVRPREHGPGGPLIPLCRRCFVRLKAAWRAGTDHVDRTGKPIKVLSTGRTFDGVTFTVVEVPSTPGCLQVIVGDREWPLPLATYVDMMQPGYAAHFRRR